LTTDLETACDLKHRGGFERLRSQGMEKPMVFEIYYREASGDRPITYELVIDRVARQTSVFMPGKDSADGKAVLEL